MTCCAAHHNGLRSGLSCTVALTAMCVEINARHDLRREVREPMPADSSAMVLTVEQWRARSGR